MRQTHLRNPFERTNGLNINELHASYRDGDRRAEELLFRRLSDSFHVFAQHKIWSETDADEIVQDALLTIKAKLGELEVETSFSAWCYRVLENKILHYYRSKKRREDHFVPTEDCGMETSGPLSDPEFRRQLLECIRKLGRVNNRHARVVNLRYQGYSTEEICERLDVTRNNLYIILSRARSMLKLCLEKGTIR